MPYQGDMPYLKINFLLNHWEDSGGNLQSRQVMSQIAAMESFRVA